MSGAKLYRELLAVQFDIVWLIPGMHGVFSEVRQHTVWNSASFHFSASPWRKLLTVQSGLDMLMAYPWYVWNSLSRRPMQVHGCAV